MIFPTFFRQGRFPGPRQPDPSPQGGARHGGDMASSRAAAVVAPSSAHGGLCTGAGGSRQRVRLPHGGAAAVQGPGLYRTCCQRPQAVADRFPSWCGAPHRGGRAALPGQPEGRSRSCPAAKEGHGGSIACGPGRRAARAEGGHASGHGRRAPPCRPRAVAAAFRRTGAWRPSRRHRVTRRPGYAGAVPRGPSCPAPGPVPVSVPRSRAVRASRAAAGRAAGPPPPHRPRPCSRGPAGYRPAQGRWPHRSPR